MEVMQLELEDAASSVSSSCVSLVIVCSISCEESLGPKFVQGGPSALGKKYVDIKTEVTFSCMFVL